MLSIDGRTLSFTEIRDAAAGMAGTLRAAGIERGDRVASLCDNRFELVELILGCAWLGAVAVPLNTAMRGDQLSHALSNSGARLLLAADDLMAVLQAIPRPEALTAVWVLGSGSPGAPHDWPARVAPTERTPVPAADVGPQDLFAILYTSGTTGVSKGVCCPHAQMYWWGVLVGEHLRITDEDVLFTCLPMFHTNAINAFFQALVAEARFCVAPRFSASRFWESAASHGATVTYLLGAMVSILMGRPPSDGDRAHRLRIALSPATPKQLNAPFRERFGLVLMEGYGSTETNLVMGAAPDEQRPGYLGRALPEFTPIIVDEYDMPVPDGTPGELVIRHHEPHSVATGYFEMPEKTVEAWRNLWFHTGDRVVRESDGWFRFVDRIKDAIRRRGENISSFEVEQAILDHPAVDSAAVYGVPSELGEDEVMVTLVLKPGVSLDPVELVRHCEPRLAYFAIPRFVEITDELPLTENGKIRKAVLRERGVSQATWDREAVGYQLRR